MCSGVDDQSSRVGVGRGDRAQCAAQLERDRPKLSRASLRPSRRPAPRRSRRRSPPASAVVCISAGGRGQMSGDRRRVRLRDVRRRVALRLAQASWDRAEGDRQVAAVMCCSWWQCWQVSTRSTTRRVASITMFDGKFRASVDRAVKPVGTGLERTRHVARPPHHAGSAGRDGRRRSPSAPASCASACCSSCWPRCPTCSTARWPRRRTHPANAARSSTRSSTASPMPCCSAVSRGTSRPTSRRISPLLPFGVMALSSVISYERAKAESLGLEAKGGLMERAERIIALCIGLLFPPLLIPILWIMLVLTVVTAVQRFVKVWKQAASRRSRRRGSRCAAAAGRAGASCAPSGAARASLARVASVGPAATPDRCSWTTSRRVSARAPMPIAQRLTDAATVGAFRLGSLAARLMPGPVAAAAASSLGFGASVAVAGAAARCSSGTCSASTRRWAAPRCVSPRRRRSTATPATTWRASGCRRCRSAPSSAGFSVEGYHHVTDGARRRQRRHPGAAAPRRLGVGRTVDDRPGSRDDRGGRAARSARAVRVVRRAAQGPRHDRRAARARSAGSAVLKALRSNEVVCLLCDRDLDRTGVEVEFFGERTTLPAGPGHAVAAHRRAAAARRRATSRRATTATTASSARRCRRTASAAACATTSPRHPSAGPRARVPHPPRPRAMAHVPAQLAQRPGLRRLTWHDACQSWRRSWKSTCVRRGFAPFEG